MTSENWIELIGLEAYLLFWMAFCWWWDVISHVKSHVSWELHQVNQNTNTFPACWGIGEQFIQVTFWCVIALDQQLKSIRKLLWSMVTGGTMAHRRRVVIPRAERFLNFIQFLKPFWERLTLNDLNMLVESDTGSLHASRFFIYWFDPWINRMHQMLLINHSITQRVHIPFHSLLSRWCSFSLKIGCGISFHYIHMYT